MVGTSPMSSPACRQAIACSCMASADSKTTGLAGGVLVLRGWEGAIAHVLVERARGGLDRLTEFGVLADEFRDVGWIQSKDILDDEHLAIATSPRPDTAGRHGKRLSDPLAEPARE